MTAFAAVLHKYSAIIFHKAPSTRILKSNASLNMHFQDAIYLLLQVQRDRI